MEKGAWKNPEEAVSSLSPFPEWAGKCPCCTPAKPNQGYFYYWAGMAIPGLCQNLGLAPESPSGSNESTWECDPTPGAPVQDGRDPCTSLLKSWPCSCALGSAGKEPSRGNLCPAELSPNQTQPLQDTSSAPSTALALCPGWKEMFGFDLSVEAGTWPA